MGFPNSTEEIDNAMMWEGIELLPEIEQEFVLERIYEERKSERLNAKGYGYWLDNCGDDKWYCDHCLQRRECDKRNYYGW